MNRIKSTFWGVCIFLLGCAVANVAGPLLVPPIRAGTSPQKWEQLCVPAKDAASDAKTVPLPYAHTVNLPTGWNHVLASYGEQGWELVQMYGSADELRVACFKRPR
jgi:hypothetical protein